MSTFYSRKAIQRQSAAIHLWKNVEEFVFNPLNYETNSNKAEKTQIAIVIIAIIAASIKMKYGSV